MLTDNRREELLNMTKYNPQTKPHSFMVKVRANPYLHSIMLKSMVWYSRNILSKPIKEQYKQNISLFDLNAEEKEHVEELKENGITIFENYFDENLISTIQKKVDELFKKLKINKNGGYNVSHGRLKTLEGISYEELFISEESISLSDPLLNVKEFVDFAFHESFLKIVSNYFEFIPQHQVGASRAFPHLPPIESSYFHKDSGDHEVLHVFVYLVDVDENGGPFCYIPKSHTNDVKSCSPRTNYDLGKKEAYGRISDEEVKKYYPDSEWLPVKAKKGSVVIAHVNGLHKGPMWIGNDSAKLNPRDIFQINFRSLKSRNKPAKNGKIHKKDIENFSNLQKLFLANYEVID